LRSGGGGRGPSFCFSVNIFFFCSLLGIGISSISRGPGPGGRTHTLFLLKKQHCVDCFFVVFFFAIPFCWLYSAVDWTDLDWTSFFLFFCSRARERILCGCVIVWWERKRGI
jgi:hypothetical protein